MSSRNRVRAVNNIITNYIRLVLDVQSQRRDFKPVLSPDYIRLVLDVQSQLQVIDFSGALDYIRLVLDVQSQQCRQAVVGTI